MDENRALDVGQGNVARPTHLTESEDEHPYSGRNQTIAQPTGRSVPSSPDEASLPSDMESHEAYRRKKKMMSDEDANGAPLGGLREGAKVGKLREASDAPSHMEEHTSERSLSTSDDLELDPINSDGSQSDDEETGLTRSDKRNNKKRRRKAQELGARIAGTVEPHNTSYKSAERNVLRALFLNSLLVASWYFFSLSISIVSHLPFPFVYGAVLTQNSVQQMDVH